ncbi:MAG: SMC family ATPase [bacterium]
MIISGLKANHFMRFDQFELKSLPERGLTGIFGDNECGKSTIGELICFSIFGRTTKAVDGEPSKIIRWGQDTCTSEITFSTGSQSFRIMRRLSADGTRDGRMVNLTTNEVLASNPDQIEARVAELLGYSFKEFRYSMFIAQKELDIILHDANDRRLVLNNMLGVGFMEKTAKRIASKRINDETELKEIRRRLDDKQEVLAVYKARERDMDRIDRRMDESNRKLLEILRERDRVKSTISMLDDIRRKAEQVDVLDMRIKGRREQLKQVEVDCSRLMRDADKLPSLRRDKVEKEALARELREKNLAAIDEKYKLLEEWRAFAEKRDSAAGQLELKEAALSDLSRKLDAIAALDKELREREMEHSSIDYFIQSFSGPDRFNTICSHMMKDVDLLNSEIDRARTATRRDLDMELEREQAFQRQLDRVRKQIDSTTMDQTDPDQLIKLQIAERSNSRVRDISLGLAALCFIAGVVLTLVFNNTTLLAVLSLMIPTLGAAFVFQSRLRDVRHNLQDLQRQSYAFNIAQRSIFEFKETVEELEERLESIKTEYKGSEETLKIVESIKTAGFKDLEQQLEMLNKNSVRELERARGLMKDILTEYEILRNLVDDSLPFVEIINIDSAAMLTEKEQRRNWLEDRIREIRAQMSGRNQVIEQSEGLLNTISSIRTQIAKIEAGMASLGVTDQDEAAIKAEEQEIYAGIEQLNDEIAQCEMETKRIESQTEEAAKLEERRREIISDIDGDLIKYYELRESTHDIDCSDQKFAALTSQQTDLEERILESRGSIREYEAEKRIIAKDLDRIGPVQDEIAIIESTTRDKEAAILKYRELENLFQQTGLDIKKRLVPQIESYFGWILPKMTRGRYHKVRLNDNFDIQVYSDEFGGYVDIESLSGGTVDQLLISLRLAFARAATAHSGSAMQFLFLDEPFSSFDESRQELFFNLLETLKSNFQQIFLISHLPYLEDFVDHFLRVDLSADQPTVTSWT